MACVCALSFLQRFQQLQANKKKLDGYKGKVLWVEASVLLEKVDEAKSAHAKVEAELKEVKTQVRAKDAACKPLDDAKAKYETSLRKIHEQHKQALGHATLAPATAATATLAPPQAGKPVATGGDTRPLQRERLGLLPTWPRVASHSSCWARRWARS